MKIIKTITYLFSIKKINKNLLISKNLKIKTKISILTDHFWTILNTSETLSGL